MEIVCSTDNNYIMPTGVMLTSLCINNQSEDVHVHVLGSNLMATSRESLRRIVEKYGKNITFHQIDESRMADFPINRPGQSSHISSLATYYRLFLADIMPESVKKVIYLDGDIIVRHSLAPMWNTEIDGFAIAGIPDMSNNQVAPYNRLLYPQALGYVNAGVLLINLDYWRRNDVKADFYDLARSHPERLGCHDQDILNYVFRNHKLLLDAKFNMQSSFLFEHQYTDLTYDIIAQIDASLTDPVIIHYVTGPKPWQRNCIHPYQQEFLKYRNLTEWKDMAMQPGDSMRLRIRHRLVKILVDLGFFKRDSYVKYKFRKDAVLK